MEFRRIRPVDYKLCQVADLICTLEMVLDKAETNNFSKSETELFDTPRDFRKKIYKNFSKKKL